MIDKYINTKPVAAAVGVAFVSSLAASATAMAAENPFEAADLDTGYLVAGGEKTEEGKCGCGIDDADSDYDGRPDCYDSCPNDPNKTETGVPHAGIWLCTLYLPLRNRTSYP